MTDAPERIWAYAGSFKMWRDHKTDRPHTQTEYIRADLATPMRCAECDCEKGGADCNWIATPAAAVKVKPLVWVKHPAANAWRCDTLIGTYKVFEMGPSPTWDFDGFDAEGISVSTSKAEVSAASAKAAAQTDYEARIMSALEPARD